MKLGYEHCGLWRVQHRFKVRHQLFNLMLISLVFRLLGFSYWPCHTHWPYQGSLDPEWQNPQWPGFPDVEGYAVGTPFLRH